MSRDDNYKRLKARWLASLQRSIEKSEQRKADIKENEKQVALFVQSRNPTIFTDNDVKKIIRSVGASIVQEIPFPENQGVQFEIGLNYYQLAILLQEGREMICTKSSPFTRRAHGFYPTFDKP